MSEARKALRAAVRGAWDKNPALIAIQDELTKVGFNKISAAYKECLMTSTKSLKDCYKDAAKAADLSKAYRDVWGAK